MDKDFAATTRFWRRRRSPRFGLVIHAVDIQNRNRAPLELTSRRKRWPWLRYVFADAGDAGPTFTDALRDVGKWTVEIIKRPDAT